MHKKTVATFNATREQGPLTLALGKVGPKIKEGIFPQGQGLDQLGRVKEDFATLQRPIVPVRVSPD